LYCCLNRSDVDASTETAITIVIVILNVTLKLFVQVLAAKEMHWTLSQMVRIYALIASNFAFLEPADSTFQEHFNVQDTQLLGHGQ